MQWFIDNHPEFHEHVETLEKPGGGVRRLLSITTRDQIPCVLRYMLDQREFLSPYGIRALSQFHREHPYILAVPSPGRGWPLLAPGWSMGCTGDRPAKMGSMRGGQAIAGPLYHRKIRA